MIQKYIKTRASKDNLLQLICAYETWTQWWPGMKNVVVVKNEQNLVVLDIVFKAMTTIKFTLEFDMRNEGIIKFRQIKGWFKTYEGDWTFLPSADNVGITIKITMMVKCGMMVPKSMVFSQLTQNLVLLDTAINKMLQNEERPATEKTEQLHQTPQKQLPSVCSKEADTEIIARKSINIFETKEGLEIWISGIRYLMKAAK